MPIPNLKNADANPAVYRLKFKASNGYTNTNEPNLYKSLTKALKAADKFCADARKRECKWGTAEIESLFECKDTGLLLEHPNHPALLRAFGVKSSA